MQGDEKEAAADDDLPPVKYEGEYIKAIMDQGEGKAAGTGRLKIPRDAPQLMVTLALTLTLKFTLTLTLTVTPKP